MATNLKDFTAGELAAAVGIALKRGRPSAETRAALEAKVEAARKAGKVKIKGGELVAV